MATIALYRTLGPKAEKHRAVLYFGANLDWTSIQLDRNGSRILLATAEETSEAEAFRLKSKRARSLQYDGKGFATLAGLREDLESLAFDPATVARFVNAARPFIA